MGRSVQQRKAYKCFLYGTRCKNTLTAAEAVGVGRVGLLKAAQCRGAQGTSEPVGHMHIPKTLHTVSKLSIPYPISEFVPRDGAAELKHAELKLQRAPSPGEVITAEYCKCSLSASKKYQTLAHACTHTQQSHPQPHLDTLLLPLHIYHSLHNCRVQPAVVRAIT